MVHRESFMQRLCVRWFNLQHSSLRGLLFAVPNGGKRNAREAGILKAEGVVAGVADLILLLPRGGFSALCIEMKTPQGKQTPLQKQWQQIAQEQGKVQYVICRSLEEFRTQINLYLSL